MNISQRISASLRALGAPLVDALEDLALLGGGGLVAFGVWEFNRPAGHITAGVLLIAGSILRARGAV